MGKTFMAAIIVCTMLLSIAAGIQTVKVEGQNFYVKVTMTLITPTQNKTYTNNMYCAVNLKVEPQFSYVYVIDESVLYRIDNNSNVLITTDEGLGTEIYLGDLQNGTHKLTVTTQVKYVISASPYSSNSNQYRYATVYVQQFPSINFSVLSIPASIQIFSPQNQTYNTSDITLNAVTSFPFSYYYHTNTAAVSYSIDNQSDQHYVYGPEILPGWTDGSHSITIHAFKNDETVFFSVDTTPPNISDLSIENRTFISPDVPVRFNVNETSQIAYSLDNQANVSVNGNFTLNGLTEGTHSIVIYANDNVGNMGKTNIAFFTVNKATPSPSPTPKANFSDWIPYATIAVAVGLGASAQVYFKKRKK